MKENYFGVQFFSKSGNTIGKSIEVSQQIGRYMPYRKYTIHFPPVGSSYSFSRILNLSLYFTRGFIYILFILYSVEFSVLYGVVLRFCVKSGNTL